MKSVMNSCCCMLLIGLSAGVVSTTSAETVVLDFAEGESSGFNIDDRYEVVTTHLIWAETGFGTEGALFAWGNGQSVGVIDVIAEDGYQITGLSFDLSGYGDWETAAKFGYFVDQGKKDPMDEQVEEFMKEDVVFEGMPEENEYKSYT